LIRLEVIKTVIYRDWKCSDI